MADIHSTNQKFERFLRYNLDKEILDEKERTLEMRRYGRIFPNEENKLIIYNHKNKIEKFIKYKSREKISI